MILKGISAGHLSNYILQLHKVDGEEQVKSIYEIDLEELLLPYNRLTDVENLTLGGTLAKDPKESVKSLILCRMWILGLPQAEKPFDRAALMLMSHKGLLPLLKQYHQNALTYSRMDIKSWEAQYQRVKQMQEICQTELNKEHISLSLRDLYFAIFGGEHLWKIAKEKNYPAMVSFNNLISDPCQHIITDFANPSSIPLSKRLEEPSENTQDGIDTMNFYRKMENLEIKLISPQE